MVESLLAMKSKLEEILSDAFQNDESFVKSLKDSFEYFINRRSNKPAELVAKFADAELKGGSKGKSEEEMESTLEKALMLFRYIQVSPAARPSIHLGSSEVESQPSSFSCWQHCE